MTGMRWLVSLVTVQHRARGASPTSSVLTQTAPKWLMRDCCHPAAHFLLPPSVDSENHLDEIKTAALLGRPADQWQGGRRSWQRRREWGGLLRSGKEGFLCNGVENTEERQAHAFCYFWSSYTPSLPLASSLSASCSLSRFYFILFIYLNLTASP